MRLEFDGFEYFGQAEGGGRLGRGEKRTERGGCGTLLKKDT